ncbi:DNA-formamidopyrimidine glycosylase [Fischerella major NIES-592]|uniref:Formamidopyrimidine-DNA glycosylase n=1 Tax=Fischerella major NIES-592 TaxID=210994 RepID=A0A1U7GVN6_9CYAN|nr:MULTISPECIES: DNA-formamidopyrimidine glycosylase [Fischerella]OKH12241.1 DNA-formamidopyrimidine glycosylase [Fischerella major NIES-592]BAU05065.1 formamidopyrimidine-DNA glycosylase [Fischerella sp. NIES-3754]BCX07318.1 MAG: formamidopyrimidine-DNA glycosylase [Fischerella sp.]
MPELPEVETVRRGLNELTLNQEITGGDVLLHRTIAYPFSVDDFVTGIQGSAISTWHRRGKYLLAELTLPLIDKGVKVQGGHGAQGGRLGGDIASLSFPTPPTSYLGVHLRMTGQLLWLRQDEPLHKHTRVRLFFQDGWELRFVDQRTFGQMWWVSANQAPESIITGLAKLAADPFSSEFTVEYLAEKFKNRRRPIKTALLDQSVVAGLGNIYADEALFMSGILPETMCIDLQREQIEKLRSHIIKVLETSIKAGGTTFSNFLNVKGINGNYGGVAWVYNRAGEPCRVCGTVIQRTRLAGRSSHFCLQCQR